MRAFLESYQVATHQRRDLPWTILPIHLAVSSTIGGFVCYLRLLHQRYEVVRDMELDFLFEHWDQLKTSRKLIDSIAGIVRGEQPHAADVMTAIFARANA